MPPINSQQGSEKTGGPGREDSVFRPITLESGFVLTSLWQQIRESWRDRHVTVPKEFSRGEARLPVSESQSPFSSLLQTLRSLFEKPQAPAIPITSRPVEVPDLWADYKPEWYSGVNSLLAISILLAMMLMPAFVHVQSVNLPKGPQVTELMLNMPHIILPPAVKKAGGGGGGNKSPTPASKGEAPRFSWRQFAPPVVKVTIPKPKLPVEPTLLGPPQVKLPEVAMNVWGNPAAVPGPPSLGQGSGGGIGPGHGAGFGPGSGGGFGGGVFSVGGDVSAPVPIYAPEPRYSERAREAKYQGTDVLSIIVTTKGTVEDAQVIRPLGLGLDEQALKTVRTWRFRPAMRNGHPVAVRVDIEVTFRLF